MANKRTSEPGGFAAFSQAERALWDHYDLEPADRLVSIGDERVVRIHEVGEGAPALFVHGTGGSGVYFAPLVAELASSYRCVLMDRPGWTLSTPVDYSDGDFGTIAAELLKDLLDALGLDRAHLVGGSIGNLYALRLALRHSDRVGSVVLLGGLPAAGLTPPTFLRLLRTPIGQIIMRIPQRPPMIRKQLGRLGHGASLANDAIPDRFIDMKVAESRYTSGLEHERNLVRCVLSGKGFKPGVLLRDQELAAIEACALMVYGSDDPVGSEDLWSDFMGSLPNGALNVVPDGGHLPWYDSPGDVGSLVRSHLAASPPVST